MKLTAGDFRFVSAWVQGVDVPDAWERYMRHRAGGDHKGDLRRIRSTARAILDQLAALAKRHGDPETAALLRRDGARIKDPKDRFLAGVLSTIPSAKQRPSAPPRSLPTLEAFIAELENPDFYSEAELIELLEERYGKVADLRPDAPKTNRRPRDTPELRAEKRRGRLVQRQLDSLRRLETLAVALPMPEDETVAWLDASTAKRLQAVGVLRLSELMFYMRLHGYRWYRKVPRIGEGGAMRLVRWLQEHEATLGAVDITAVLPRAKLDMKLLARRPSMGLVPLERLQVPSSLSGIDGINRAPVDRCKARARNDYAAVQEWLELRRPTGQGTDAQTGNEHTYRAYRKEAERFLLWAIFERHKALSSLDHTDCIEYRRFLSAPSNEWIGERSAQRWSEHWRPFEGPLSLRSRKTAEVIVTALCGWLVKVRYLDSNPWEQVPKGSRALPLQALRSLSDKQWIFVSEWLGKQPTGKATDRLRVMLSLALATGMREAEMAGARAGWLQPDVDEEGHPAWNLVVTGKGGKQREVPLTGRVTKLLFEHLATKGLGPEVRDINPNTPLLSALEDPMRPMAAPRVYELVKAAFEACAQSLGRAHAEDAERIRQASPHWLRHTHGRKFVEAGGDRGILRQNLGHASDATTAIYDRSGARRRRREVEKVFG